MKNYRKNGGFTGKPTTRSFAINESELPKRDRIIHRIESYLKDKNIELRPNGGFNHYAVASYFASNPPTSLNDKTLSRFEELFKAVNKVL